tara:strand:- start:53 stop:397 length:345 start_codon:yes stop_codon:yes gene_type:complete
MAEKKYDLEDRTFWFAVSVRKYIHKLPKSIKYHDDCTQVTRSSGSIGANYIEANEALSKKDFVYRIKVCRKEAKETVYWLRLLKEGSFLEGLEPLIQEAKELLKIFSAIYEKSK